MAQKKRANWQQFLFVTPTVAANEQDYWRSKLLRHQSREHTKGVVDGLTVRETTPPSLSVEVVSGRALDSVGEDILVESIQTLDLESLKPGAGSQTVYITISHSTQETDAKFSDALNANLNQFVQDVILLEATTTAPADPTLELGRVDLSSAATTITDAVTPASPATNEIDLTNVLTSGPANPISNFSLSGLDDVSTDEAAAFNAMSAPSASNPIATLTDLRSQVDFNYAFNADMEIYGAGTSAAPTGWTLAGAGASVAKDTGAGKFKFGTAAAALTRAGADCKLTQNVVAATHRQSKTVYGPIGARQSQKVSLGVWTWASVGSRVRVGIDDGVSVTYSSYHTGGSSLEFLSVNKTLSASATKVEIVLAVDTGNTTGYFDSAILIRGSSVTSFVPSGWSGMKGRDSWGTNGQFTGPDFFGPGGERLANDAGAVPEPFRHVKRNFFVHMGDGNVGAGTNSVTLRKNASDTSLSISLTGAVSTGSDETNEVEYAQGDLTDIRVGMTGLSNRIGVSWEVEEIPEGI